MPNANSSMKEWSDWVNAATDHAQRQARKAIAFPFLYGNPCKLSNVLKQVKG